MKNIRRDLLYSSSTDEADIQQCVILLNQCNTDLTDPFNNSPTAELKGRIDVQTHKGKVASHPTTSAVLVPHWWYPAGTDAMRRQAAVRTGAARAVFLDVALSPTKNTSRTFLHDQRKTTLVFLFLCVLN